LPKLSRLELDFDGPSSGSRGQQFSRGMLMPLSDADSCRLVSSLPSREREPAMPLGTVSDGFIMFDPENLRNWPGRLNSSWLVSSSWTEARGTSRQGTSSRGLLARNSTISEARVRSLGFCCQQDFNRPRLKQEENSCLTIVLLIIAGAGWGFSWQQWSFVTCQLYVMLVVML
jgi:hypothetical protein